MKAVELKVKRRGALCVGRRPSWRDDRPPVGRVTFHGELAAISDMRGLLAAVVKDGKVVSVEANLDLLTADGDHLAEHRRRLLVQRAPFLGLPRAAHTVCATQLS
jgi:hypothetical protein